MSENKVEIGNSDLHQRCSLQQLKGKQKAANIGPRITDFNYGAGPSQLPDMHNNSNNQLVEAGVERIVDDQHVI